MMGVQLNNTFRTKAQVSTQRIYIHSYGRNEMSKKKKNTNKFKQVFFLA